MSSVKGLFGAVILLTYLLTKIIRILRGCPSLVVSWLS